MSCFIISECKIYYDHPILHEITEMGFWIHKNVQIFYDDAYYVFSTIFVYVYKHSPLQMQIRLYSAPNIIPIIYQNLWSFECEDFFLCIQYPPKTRGLSTRDVEYSYLLHAPFVLSRKKILQLNKNHLIIANWIGG